VSRGRREVSGNGSIAAVCDGCHNWSANGYKRSRTSVTSVRGWSLVAKRADHNVARLGVRRGLKVPSFTATRVSRTCDDVPHAFAAPAIHQFVTHSSFIHWYYTTGNRAELASPNVPLPDEELNFFTDAGTLRTHRKITQCLGLHEALNIRQRQR